MFGIRICYSSIMYLTINLSKTTILYKTDHKRPLNYVENFSVLVLRHYIFKHRWYVQLCFYHGFITPSKQNNRIVCILWNVKCRNSLFVGCALKENIKDRELYPMIYQKLQFIHFYNNKVWDRQPQNYYWKIFIGAMSILKLQKHIQYWYS